MNRITYDKTNVSPENIVFGRASAPVKCGLGLEIGAGAVYPEVNYTLPPVRITSDTLADVRSEYQRMVSSILTRAEHLQTPGLVLEFEQPFELTSNADWGALITQDTKQLMRESHTRSGMPSALRVTIADIRDKTRPPRMRTGKELQLMLDAFAKCASAGADILSIESTGGKEISDAALTEGDLGGVLFGMASLGGRDTAFLWDEISAIAKRTGTVSGGDSACGFGNTAMRLADMSYISRIFAAVVRAASAARSLVAFEHGAVGPSKDCAYEGIYIKALRGVPLSLEGKSAACAHFSHIGNIASAYADLWSNESVQNVRLLSGYAPEVFTEILIYDCRLMNEALRRGEEQRLREWLIATDALLDPQAFVLLPEVVAAVAKELAEHQGTYERALASARVAAFQLGIAVESGRLALADKEKKWLGRLQAELEDFPKSDAEFCCEMLQDHREKFLAAEYGL